MAVGAAGVSSSGVNAGCNILCFSGKYFVHWPMHLQCLCTHAGPVVSRLCKGYLQPWIQLRFAQKVSCVHLL